MFCSVLSPTLQRTFGTQKGKQNRTPTREDGVGIPAYLTILINWYQAFDGYVPDVAAAEEDFACRR